MQLTGTCIVMLWLWNACDYVIQYYFLIVPVAGSIKTSADILSRTEVNPTKKLEMSMRNDIQTKAFNIQSSVIVEEERIYVLPNDEFDENQLWQEKEMRGIELKLKHITTQRTMSQHSNNSMNLRQARTLDQNVLSETMPETDLNKTMTLSSET